MPSFASRATAWLLTVTRFRHTLARQFARPVRKPGEGRPPALYYRRYHLTETQLRGRTVYAMAPKGGATSPLQLVYLHGGAFVVNANPPNWSLVARLVDALGCTVVAPDYPLAPEHPAPAAAEFVRALYEETLRPAAAAGQLVLLGDSAGGALALGLCQQLAAEGAPPPRRLVLLWPWLDLTLTDPLVAAVAPYDPLLLVEGLLVAARHYVGPEADLADPRLSPLNGPLADLPPLSVFIGGRDSLVADARRLRDRAARAGQPLRYYEYAGMMHGWLLLPFLPESRRALADVVAEIRADEPQPARANESAGRVSEARL